MIEEVLGVISPVIWPAGSARRRPEIVAMVHVHSTTAILNHQYSSLLGIEPPTEGDIRATNYVIGIIAGICQHLEKKFPIVTQVCPDNSLMRNFRSFAFLCERTYEIAEAIAKFRNIGYVQRLIDRALKEAEAYVQSGITHIEVENVAAPYFMGPGQCPWEELLILLLVCRAIRKKFPTVALGVHVLSCNELEALPIAICCGAGFIRSECTLFSGMRPEGQTPNHGNLARFFYLRKVLRSLTGSPSDEAGFPLLWSDCLKKHTVFPEELMDLRTWTSNITFMKLEGVVITGQETGSDAQEGDLKVAREAIQHAEQWAAKAFNCGTPERPAPTINLVTGSGGNFEMYCKYADYMIVGTAFKSGGYWENEVDPERVRSVVDRVKGCEQQQSP